ncbi:MAG: glycosyltransferase family 4 protein [Cyclobacteriaceae bacterium]
MHVLFVAGWYPTEDAPLEGVFIREHARAIASFCQISVVFIQVKKVTTGGLFNIKVNRTQNDQVNEYRITITTRIRKFGIHDYLIKRAYGNTIRLIEKNGPINICHINVRNHITRLIVHVEQIRKLPIVYSEHWSYYRIGIQKLSLTQRHNEIKELKKWFSMLNMKAVLPVSQDLGRILINLGANPSQVSVVPNIANAAFSYNKTGPRNSSEIRILMVAIWQYPKNPLLFLKALKLLPLEILERITVRIIGPGSQLEVMKEYVESNLLSGRIDFLGERNKTFIAKELNKASFLVHPSDSENLPCIILESLSCGVPVMSNQVGGIPELIHSGNGRLSPCGNVEKFKLNLLNMIENMQTFNRREIARDASKQFSCKEVGKQIFNIYKSVSEES